MPTDFNGREPDSSQNGEDAPLFASQPIWERGRKRRGFGGRKTAAPAPAVAPEPRAFAREEPAMTLDRPVDRPMDAAPERPIDRPATTTNTTLAAEEPMATPIGRPMRTTRAKASSGASPAVIAGGLAALLVIGAGGWYLSRPHDGVPVLAPGQPTSSEVAAAPVTPDTGGVSVATNTLPARAESARAAATPMPRATRQVAQQARVRPAARAAALSAAETGANASAILPDGPRPYSSINPAAPTQVTPAAPPPVEAAPPAAIPQTPPVQTPQTAPAPSETPTTPPPSA